MDTPISEIAIIGAAVGAALTGMRPVAEMQYGDFVFCGMDQVINQAAKMRYMSNGQFSVPLVLRLPVGATMRGAQHAQCTEAYFMHTPGLKVVCPSNPYNAKGLLLASIWDDDPVIFLEQKLLYGGKNFMDYYHYHSGKENAFSSLGYWLPNYFPEAKNEMDFETRLQKVRCRHFCFIHPNARRSSTPFWGRRLCDLSTLVWKVKGLTGKKSVS